MKLKFRIFMTIFFISFILSIYYFQNSIIGTFNSYISDVVPINKEKANQYQTKGEFNFISYTKILKPTNKTGLYNLYYSALDSGVDTFQFYCNNKYKECMNDVKALSEDDAALSDINSFVHPYNSFNFFTTTYTNLKLVTLKITHNYSKQQVTDINQKVTEIEKAVIKPGMSNRDKIKAVHDYIINLTKYDKNRADTGVSSYQSNIAYGPLFEKYAICSGYTDAMAIFLHRWKIPNYKITSDSHVWNLVYIDNKWLHLDLTFDDPILSNGKEIISSNYFLITTSQLLKLDQQEHNFNRDVFKEADY